MRAFRFNRPQTPHPLPFLPFLISRIGRKRQPDLESNLLPSPSLPSPSHLSFITHTLSQAPERNKGEISIATWRRSCMSSALGLPIPNWRSSVSSRTFCDPVSPPSPTIHRLSRYSDTWIFLLCARYLLILDRS